MIRWLHVSDIHEHKGPDYSRESLYTQIVEAVRNRPIKPDVVFLTGDLAFSGTKPEYETLRRSFIDPLRGVLPDVPFFAVPGNHDLDRNRLVNPRDWMTNQSMADLFHEAGSKGAQKREEMIVPRFREFMALDKEISAWTQKDWLISETGAAAWRGKIAGVDVGIVGLNTAWLCHDGQDWGKLTPGRNLLKRALRDVAADGPPALLFVLGHHPLEAFIGEGEDPDHRHVVEALQRSHALYLHGHQHKAEQKRIGEGPRGMRVIQAPSAFQSPDSLRWRNGVLWGRADPVAGKLFLEPHLWNSVHGEFKLDPDAGYTNELTPERDAFRYDLPSPPRPGAGPGSGGGAAIGAMDAPGIGKPAHTPPQGWRLVDRAALAEARADAPTEAQMIGYFDGQMPNWRLALAASISPRNIVAALAARFSNLHGGARKPNVVLLTGAGGDGKSTAALHIAARLVEEDPHSWTCLHRQASHAPIPPTLLTALPAHPDHAWIVVIDDADTGASAILEAVKAVQGRTDIHLLLVARRADWSLNAPANALWNSACDFSPDHPLSGLGGRGVADRRRLEKAGRCRDGPVAGPLHRGRGAGADRACP